MADWPAPLSQQMGREDEDVNVAGILFPFIKMDFAASHNGKVSLFHFVDFTADAHGNFTAHRKDQLNVMMPMGHEGDGAVPARREAERIVIMGTSDLMENAHGIDLPFHGPVPALRWSVGMISSL